MNYEEFASDLPLHHSVEFASEEESEDALHRMGIEQPVRQLGRGEFRYRLAIRSTPEAGLFADRFGTSVSMHLESPPETIAMLFPRTASGHFLASGNKVGDQKLILLPDGAGTDIVGPDLVGSESILIPRRRFCELIEALCPTPHPVWPEALAIISGNTARLHSMRSIVCTLVAHPERDPGGENLANLVATTVAWIARHSPGWKPERLRSIAEATHAAQRARDYIEQNYRATVRLEDICRATGVSARTVQRCFRNYFDVTITEYLKTVRMDSARRTLRKEHPSRTSVATVAMRHGNMHLGRFSVAYRDRFGESPKQTLAA